MKKLTIIFGLMLIFIIPTSVFADTTMLQVQMVCPSIIFPNEYVRWVIVASTPNGQPADSSLVNSMSIHATLLDNQSNSIGTPSFNSITTNGLSGVWVNGQTSFQMPSNANGFYTMIVQLQGSENSISYSGVAVCGMQASPTLNGYNAVLTNVNNNVATISTNVGNIQTSINGWNVTGINGDTVYIRSQIGDIKTNVDTIHAQLIGVNGQVGTFNSTVGSFSSQMNTMSQDVSDLHNKWYQDVPTNAPTGLYDIAKQASSDSAVGNTTNIMSIAALILGVISVGLIAYVAFWKKTVLKQRPVMTTQAAQYSETEPVLPAQSENKFIGPVLPSQPMTVNEHSQSLATLLQPATPEQIIDVEPVAVEAADGGKKLKTLTQLFNSWLQSSQMQRQKLVLIFRQSRVSSTLNSMKSSLSYRMSSVIVLRGWRIF